MHISSSETLQAKTPYFSIIILCWNTNQYLFACLRSLNNQTWKDFEILIVDNGSPEPISKTYFADFNNLSISFFQLKDNIGFAAGNNFAAAHARGEFLVLLNADAFPEPDWLETIRNAITKYPHCFFASKLIMANHPQKLDGEGDVYHISGLVWRKSYNTLESESSQKEGEVFSACGAAAVYPKEAFAMVNGFDDDYFAYLEDVDLGFRLRLAGYKCMYLPGAVVFHIGSGSTNPRSDLSVYYGHRNLVWTFFKDMPGVFVWILSPLHILVNLLMIIISFSRKQGIVSLRAKFDAFNNFSMIIQKRKTVQSMRRISAIQLIKHMNWNPFSPFVRFLHK
jgi:GT2 family glycosyltransferase